MTIAHQAVVITGAGSGIGRATALLLAAKGFTVFAGVRRAGDGVALQRTAEGYVVPVNLDVTDAPSIAAAVKRVEIDCPNGPVSVVNNAGVSYHAPLEYADEDHVRAQLETNVVGPSMVTKAFLPLVRRGPGRIVNVSSGAGRIAPPLAGAYAASKFALEAMSDALRLELRRWGIHVSVIEPGFVATEIHDKNERDLGRWQARVPPVALERYGDAVKKLRRANESRLKKAVSPEEVASAIHHALTARRPKTRYPVGPDARLMALVIRMLTDGMKDRIFGRMTGM